MKKGGSITCWSKNNQCSSEGSRQRGALEAQIKTRLPRPIKPRLRGIKLSTLLNVSTRGSLQTGENVLIAGFIVIGGDPKKVIIRGLGQALTRFGVSDALPDPMLELHNTTSMMSANDDWQSAANASQIPINYRPADSRESAVMTTLQPGAYTAILSGKNFTTGNGLLEVYSAPSALTNVSTRGFVGTGDRVLIGGFISGGGLAAFRSLSARLALPSPSSELAMPSPIPPSRS